MTPADDLAVQLAAERRRAEEAECREMDARRAELPRALGEDARERWQWFGRLIARVARRVWR